MPETERTSEPKYEDLPTGTPVLAFPGSRDGRAIVTTTRSEPWTLPSGERVVMVEGYAGGIAMSHIEVMPDPMTAQHPAAPETETDANGLTEAVRAVARQTGCIDCEGTGEGALGYDSDMNPRFGPCQICTPIAEAATAALRADLDAARERVRVVEGERDAWEAEAETLAVAAGNAYAYRTRAESAEAAHEAEKAAHERLRAKVEEKIAQYSRLAGQAMDPECREWLTAFVGTLRSLLGGGGAR